ncbi:tetratricopeptide repeat protein [Uliginosibacterium sediminicola]|uniref:Tetratricopeptide repeat protein n=1 Tax=Uliginosibacterium sediminicola TaxID=2024550 RepID=A0ABU9YZT1_9RHOO
MTHKKKPASGLLAQLIAPQRQNAAPPALLAQWLEQGLGFHRAGDLDAAARLYQQVLAQAPRHPEALTRLGTLHLQRGELEAGVRLLDESLKIKPEQAHALNNRATALKDLKRFDEALADYARATALAPDYVDAHANRALLLGQLGRADEALAAHERVIALRPSQVEAHHMRAVIMQERGNLAEALASYEAVLRLQSGHVDALVGRGIVLARQRHLTAALASYDAALRQQPGNLSALNNRGLVLRELGRFEEALACYAQALAIDPAHADVLTNRGIVFSDMRRLDEAEESQLRAIAAQPEHADANWNLALLRLMRGDYLRGWAGYEWRWRTSRIAPLARNFPQPLWLGDVDLQGKTILLHAEQGFGDTIQFCRYAPLVLTLGARVVLEVQPALRDLLRSLHPQISVLARGESLPAFEYQCPLMSLPLAFASSLQSVPAAPAYLQADSARRQDWQAQLGAHRRRRIGLVWSGNPSYGNDHKRSIELAALRPLLARDAEFHCLQKEIRPTDLPLLADLPIQLWQDRLHSFADTAALISELDLVISVDTAVAHLAAALGKPTWILLPLTPDFRWLLEGERSAWYPGVRLFRQQQFGDWGAPLQAVCMALQGETGA